MEKREDSGDVTQTVKIDTRTVEAVAELGAEDKLPCLELLGGPVVKVYPIIKKIVVGSENADIIIDSTDIASKHCSFRNQQGIISVVDHGGASGTIIDRKRLKVGKMILLDEGDSVRVGEMQIHVVFRSKEELDEEIEQAELLDSSSGVSIESSEDFLMKVKSIFGKKNSVNVNMSDVLSSPAEEGSGDQTGNITPTPRKDALETLFDEDTLVIKSDKPFDDILEDKEKTAPLIKKSNRAVPSELGGVEDTPKGFFRSLFGQKKAQGFKIKKGPPRTAGMLTRIIAIVGDVCCTLLISRQIVVLPEYKNIVEVIERDYGQVLLFLQEQIPLVARFYQQILLYFALRILSNALFGVSLGQLMIGLSGGRSFLWNRLGGVLRGVLEVVMAPFLVFDLPCFMRRRSAKEFLSYTYVDVHRHVIAVLGPIFFMPTLIILVMGRPSSLDPFLSPSKPLSVIKIKRLIELKNSQNIFSTHFKFTATVPEKSSYLMIPSFNLLQKANNTTIIPKMVIFSTKTGTVAQMQTVGSYKIRPFIEVAVNSNPLFRFKFPSLYKIYTNTAEKEFSEKAQKEFQMLITAAFSCGYDTLVKDIIDYNLSVIRFSAIQQAFLEKINVTKPFTVKIFKIGDGTFLVIKHLTKFIFIPIHSMQGKIWSLVVKAGKATTSDFKIVVGMLKDYLADAQWDFSLEDSSKEMNVFRVLDVFAKKNIDKNERVRLQDFIYKWYSQMPREQLEKDNNLRQTLIKSLNRLMDVTRLSSAKSSGTKKYLKKLKTLKLSLGKQ